MKLSEEAVKEFQAIVREEYGTELNDGEARIIATRLMLLGELICRQLPDEQAMPPSSAPPDDPAHATS